MTEKKQEKKQEGLFILQYQDTLLKGGIERLQDVFYDSERPVYVSMYADVRDIYQFAIPVMDKEVIVYPINRRFLTDIVPSVFRTLPQTQLDSLFILSELEEKGCGSNFLIEIPETFTEKEQTYLLKILGTCFGGFYESLSNLPTDGVLNEESHIFITPSRSYFPEVTDVLDNMELLLIRWLGL